MDQPSASARPGLREFEFRARIPMDRMDKNIIIVTASLLGVLILALCTLFIHEWLRKRATLISKPVRPPGIKPLQLDALPTSVFAAPCLLGHPPPVSTCPCSASPICPICLAAFVVGERIRILPRCAHAFHVGCIDAWLCRQSSCPTCRENVVEEAAPIEGSVLQILVTPRWST